VAGVGAGVDEEVGAGAVVLQQQLLLKGFPAVECSGLHRDNRRETWIYTNLFGFFTSIKDTRHKMEQNRNPDGLQIYLRLQGPTKYYRKERDSLQIREMLDLIIPFLRGVSQNKYQNCRKIQNMFFKKLFCVIITHFCKICLKNVETNYIFWQFLCFGSLIETFKIVFLTLFDIFDLICIYHAFRVLLVIQA